MVTNSPSPHGPHSPWGARLGTLALWAAAGASVVFWGLRLSAPAAQAMLPAVPDAVAPDAQALARLLGARRGSAGGCAAGPVRADRCAVGSPQWRRRGADCGRWQTGPTISHRG